MINNLIIRQSQKMFVPNEDYNSESLQVKSIVRGSEGEQKIVIDGVDEIKKQNKKYMKVSQSKKQQLCQIIEIEGKKIKEAARIVGIKYATAKTIIFYRRQKRKEKRENGTSMCGYTELMEKRVNRLQIISIIGNDVKQCKEYIL
ncbi:unnamed protein product [Paramecium sonneborni]|uniref:Uncharacterized protein n=1 Tax=Paramecium sonneborni TaxID=65129 RepID=A0A8S1QAD7_9CILI|nr:unnamed protein product [Paramecium sonneborni]